MVLFLLAIFPSDRAVSREGPIEVAGDSLLYETVQSRLADFASAWSRGASSEYIDFFVPGYAPEGWTPERWQADRRRLVRPQRRIRVVMIDLEVLVHGANDRVVTRFVQGFVAEDYEDKSRKSLRWQRVGDTWLIEAEESEPFGLQVPCGRDRCRR